MIGGRDFEREEKEETKEIPKPVPGKNKTIELDWSFLKKPSKKRF